MKEKLTLENGNVYEGETLNGKPHGKGKRIYADGTVKEGEWKDGEFVDTKELSMDEYW